MPFLTFHRPSFVKNVPELNALTTKGAREADAAISAKLQSGTGNPRPSLLAQYRARVSVLRAITVQQISPTSLTTILPADILERIIGDALGGVTSIQDVTRLRSVNKELNKCCDNTMRKPEQVVLALRMTRNSITNLARSSRLNDAKFRVQVNKLIDRNTHVGADLFDIASPDRRQILLDCLAGATHLRTVDLDASEVPESFAAVLDATNAMSAGNRLLTRFDLNVSGNHIGDAGAQSLAANETITNLKVNFNGIGAAGAQALAANNTITKLELDNNRIGAAGAQALATNRTLTQLSVHSNFIGDAGVQALATNTTITHLNVSFNNVGDTAAQALAANTTITELQVFFNRIGDAGAQALAANTTITELHLGNNHIGDAGAQALAANTTITQLDLDNNLIGDAGAQALAANNTITELDVGFNNISAAGRSLLESSNTIAQLRM
ncbi:hypothetical protein [Actimicrobium sp. CCI2.3]|uniref:hypothetical protein n=1 Tax=Actimicrobium sp. CCI2.3 TaxID=3048616 RepID=UPI002AB3F8B6|nr:hypothetical protein [Actimicrobium sp. CCI2.3]MDY7573103.1 hypothetical protein [Actimicrobium sp. CCI2.3]MEB0020900.1 hypothetical protein [Actimicrobium sp. CCI2.3]